MNRLTFEQNRLWSSRKRGTFLGICNLFFPTENHQLPTSKTILGLWITGIHRSRWEVGLASLRMGCIRPTHLLPYIANNFPPVCKTCKNKLITGHILIHWRRFVGERCPLAETCERKPIPFTMGNIFGDEYPDVVDGLMIFLRKTKLLRVVIYYCILSMYIIIVFLSVWMGIKEEWRYE